MNDPLFRPSHERRLLTTFRHVDELVSQAVSRLEPVAATSPLSEFVPDATPEQQKAAADSLRELRELMRGFVEIHEIPMPERRISALWAAHTAFLHAKLSVEELRAGSMRGCGKLTPESEQVLEALATELSAVLQRMSDKLGPPSGQAG